MWRLRVTGRSAFRRSSISHMPQFVSKSSEELRFEVYVACKDHDIPFKMLNYDSVIKGGCNLMLELTTDIVQAVLPLMESAFPAVRGLAREIVLKVCTQQPDSVPEVVGALKKLLQHDDDGIVENSCRIVLELCDETTEIVREVLPLMESASSPVQGLARDILLKMCTKQPDSVPEVFAAARKLLQHEDDSIVEHGCTVIFELCDETMDIIEEVIPLMDSESSGVRRLAKKIFSRVRLNNLIRAFVHQRIP